MMTSAAVINWEYHREPPRLSPTHQLKQPVLDSPPLLLSDPPPLPPLLLSNPPPPLLIAVADVSVTHV
ncbi:hypothetical protein CTI12_AA093860 [Artemisia annua]|uniref:Uncharacterized protein n=1 Tax=Artemisia annua TaxID=35608 RepID=A0A2U1PXU2_ARTAN|nr:hypothetical protein CTI12_AA093860 [Artemisia annua]